ncbi:TonB-dependent receptor [Phenylobacterium hankyongense]|uniref:TonB-dependent receptor n=1 Tax=Phenylobacterium hankyongense TaxID=1813876 RepID=A0A328AWC8_9CAUL|nr:TonB-dependent receptor [Phenylobacterium hankyongense]RAK59432.1 TonB-dependent receptor [Phenylobacterium hankyongense]
MQGRFRAALMGSGALFFAAGAQAQPLLADATAAAANEVSTVVVTAPREEAVARNRQFEAPNLVSVQAAETILKYPDFNAAEALGRMPGVSISTDTGEGRFVNIRGIDGNLTGATFGGVPMLNTNPGGTYFGGGGRAVEYDTIPTGAIDGLVVYKTTLPDHEAEGLGGSVDLTPRTAANVTRPFVEGTLGWGYEPMHDHTGPLNAEGAVGARFGFDGSHLIVEGQGEPAADRAGWMSNPTPFSFVLTGSRRDDRRGFDDMEEDFNDPTVDRSLADIQMRRYDYHRRRFGFGGEFDFKPNDDHNWYVRANVTGYKEAVQKNRLTYAGLGDTVDPANPSGFATTTNVSLASTDEAETHRNEVFVVGGQDRFGETVLDYRASYSRATYVMGQNYGAKFNGPTGLAFAYDNSANNGDKPAINVNTALVNDPAQYSRITKITNSTANDVDQEYAYAANLLFPAHLVNDSDRVKVGAEVRLRDKSATSSAFSYAISPLSLVNASSPAVTDFYGRYTNGPGINTIALRAAAAAGVMTGGVDLGSVFTAKEDIYAAYGQYQTTIGKWGVLAGVRVEQTDARYGAYSDDNPTQTLAFTTRSESYTNAFPTLQIRYEAAPNFLVRATYSTGIGRPGFLQNSATTSSNHDVTDPQISQGNPNLKPTTGNNFDLSLEYYMSGGGVVQVGVFDKEFDNYIVRQFQRRLYDGTDPTFAGMLVGYSTYANRSGAYARGVEAAYHQQFSWLPGLWNGLGLDANVTLVDSHIQEYDAATSSSGRAESGLLPGTSRVTANLAGFYEAHGLELRLASEYVSKELFSLGGSKATDTIQDNRVTLDFTSSYRLTPAWTVYFNAKNLTNAPLRFYIGSASYPIQREYYDQTFEAGVRARF